MSCKTPTGPAWPSAPHWLSACQTNCFGWRRAVNAVWSRSWEWRNSYSLLPFGPVRHILDYSMGMGIKSRFYLKLLISCCGHILRGNFTGTYRLLSYYAVAFLESFSICFQSITTSPVAVSFVHAPLKPWVISLKEGWKTGSDCPRSTSCTLHAQEVKEIQGATTNECASAGVEKYFLFFEQFS